MEGRQHDSAALYHLSWRANQDRYDVALVANRLAAHGVPVWRCTRAVDGMEAGDYLAEMSPALASACRPSLAAVTPMKGPRPDGIESVVAPRVALLAGSAAAAFFAYSALALLRLGFTYRSVDGPAIVAGALEPSTLFVLPGGSANLSLDFAEQAPGADARVRAFLEGGGTAFGTCGGASYLSSGRPGWTGTVPSCPLFNHEYLQSGVGIVSLVIEPTPLGIGCPPTLEVPYSHGPGYDLVGEGVEVAARFHRIALSSRLRVDNPLDPALFDRELAGRPAILVARGPRGHAIAASPHPEMGDLVRKYMALDGYVRKYLHLRGRSGMEATLGAYQPIESPSFRLVLNAVHHLANGTRPRPPMPAEPIDGHRLVRELEALSGVVVRTLDSIRSHIEHDDMADLLHHLAEELHGRVPVLAAAGGEVARGASGAHPEAGLLARELLVLARSAIEHLTAEGADARPVPQRFMEVEHVLVLCEVVRRVAEVDRRLSQVI